MLRRRNIQQGVFTAICKTRWSWFTTGSGLQPVVLEILWKLMQWWTQKVKSDFEPPCNNICKVRDWQREPTFKKKKFKKSQNVLQEAWRSNSEDCFKKANPREFNLCWRIKVVLPNIHFLVHLDCRCCVFALYTLFSCMFVHVFN